MRVLIVFLVWYSAQATILAQGNPFEQERGPAPKQSKVDPSGLPSLGDKSIDELKALFVKEREQAQREATLYLEQIRSLKSSLDQMNDQHNRLQSQFTLAAEGHAALTNHLLKSDDPDIQLAVIHSRLDNVGLQQFGFDNETIRILGRLTESKNDEVRKNAIGLLVSLHPEVANELGYQSAGERWKPVQLGWSKEQTKLDRVLSENTDLDYREVALIDVMGDIRDLHRVNVMTDRGIDPEKLFTLQVRNISLCEGMALLLAQHRMTLSIKNDVLFIGFIGDPNIQDTFTFNVRGLLTDKMDIEKLVGFIKEKLGDKANINLLDEHRFVANCGYLEQREIGKVLAKYNISRR